MRIQVCIVRWMNFDSQENGGKKSFLPKHSTNAIYPNENNMFIGPKHDKNRDYYENLSLSYSTNKL